MAVNSPRRKILLFLSTNMAAMTSYANHQYRHKMDFGQFAWILEFGLLFLCLLVPIRTKPLLYWTFISILWLGGKRDVMHRTFIRAKKDAIATVEVQTRMRQCVAVFLAMLVVFVLVNVSNAARTHGYCSQSKSSSRSGSFSRSKWSKSLAWSMATSMANSMSGSASMAKSEAMSLTRSKFKSDDGWKHLQHLFYFNMGKLNLII